ncbi:MAG: hypothetical protein VCF25_21900 [Candidatus Poribacteria bacterium]
MQYHRGQHPEMDSNGDGNENGQLDFDFTLIPTFSVVCPRRSTSCGDIIQLLPNMEVHPTIQRGVT